MPTGDAAPGSIRRWLLAAAVASALAGVTLVWLFMRRPASSDNPPAIALDPLPPDPRLAYAGPYLNVRPGVGYTGDASCAPCHVEVAEAYARHPMGCSMATARDLAGRQPYDEAVRNPFDAAGRRYRIEREGDRVWHSTSLLVEGKPVVTARQEVHVAVGSGARGRSYLTELDGHVFQTPISWYSQRGIWDLSPGFGSVAPPGRPIGSNCLQCHANGLRPVAGYVKRFEPGVFAGLSIGCERCHGPGEAHVAARERGDPAGDPYDTTIVNPRQLAWPLRENVCEQCHLNGLARFPRRGRDWLDYRPGLPLESFFVVYVSDPALPGSRKAVTHVEQMRRSRCFEASSGANKLGCISCHDPHEKPAAAARVASYRDRCLACHLDKGCSLPVAERRKADDSCIVCHMPRHQAADIVHTALTDHRIVRPGRPEVLPGNQPADALPVVNFYRDRLDATDPEVLRDRGVALARVLDRGGQSPTDAARLLAQGQTLLQAALGRAANDVDGWLAYGGLLMADGYVKEAIAALARAVALAPNHEEVLERLAHLEEKRGQAEAALAYRRRLIQVNPYEPGYRQGLAAALARQNDWAGVDEQVTAWLRLDPTSVPARQARVLALWHRGDRQEATRLFDALRELRPANLADLETWFARLPR